MFVLKGAHDKGERSAGKIKLLVRYILAQGEKSFGDISKLNGTVCVVSGTAFESLCLC